MLISQTPGQNQQNGKLNVLINTTYFRINFNYTSSHISFDPLRPYPQDLIIISLPQAGKLLIVSRQYFFPMSVPPSRNWGDEGGGKGIMIMVRKYLNNS